MGTIRKAIDRVVDVPSHDEASGFVLYETLIDNHRASNHVNIVTLDHTHDNHGRVVPHIQHLGKKDMPMKYFVQIADKSMREITLMDATTQLKHRPDYNREFDQAMSHAIEVKRKRMYVRIVGYGLGGVKARIRVIIEVHSKRPHYDYEHIKNPQTIRNDSIPVGGSRVVHRI